MHDGDSKREREREMGWWCFVVTDILVLVTTRGHGDRSHGLDKWNI